MKASPLTLADIRNNTAVCKLLLKPFDIEVVRHVDDDWYVIEGHRRIDCFGIEGAGGRYILLDDNRILFIDTDGLAGVVAESVAEFVDLVTGAPYWQDLLQFSCGGDLACMRQVETFSRTNPESENNWLTDARLKVQKALNLPQVRTSYSEQLHAAISRGENNPDVRDPDGAPYDSLFGELRPSDYAIWLKRV